MNEISIDQINSPDSLNMDYKDPILAKLKIALSQAGDYPIRTSALLKLNQTLGQTNLELNQVRDLILSEPLLGCRIIHLVNNDDSSSNNSIQTVSQAILEIGTRKILELCHGIVQSERFLSQNSNKSHLEFYLKNNLFSSIICKNLLALDSKQISEEEAYLASSFYTLGQTLLAYYFPQIFKSAKERSEQRGGSIESNVSQIIGMDFLQINIEILEALKIPSLYKAILIEASSESEYNSLQSEAVNISQNISRAFFDSDTNFNFEEFTENSSITYSRVSTLDITDSTVKSIELYNYYLKINNLEELNLNKGIDLFSSNSEALQNNSHKSDNSISKIEISSKFNDYLEEIKLAIRLNEPSSSILTTAMESLHFALGFDRVVLLLVNEPNSILYGRMSLGKTKNLNTKAIRRRLTDDRIEDSIDIKAFNNSKLTTKGFPLLKNAESSIGIPIGYSNKSLGVIYADTLSNGTSIDSKQMIASVLLLIEMLDSFLNSDN